VNEAEATVIVNEIRAIVENPAFERRTIGVISLVGDKQAKLIYDRLLKGLGPEAMERHRIMCGNAATFQGQERDIVFLSMVECPETSRAKTTRVFEQRFNVAMSRARDRLYLVRSVAPEHLSPNDLKLRILEHFQNPMEGTTVAMSDDVLDLCESSFEREVGAKLIALGYRVRPQVPVGGYRLDFVVEGEGDRRLAIECDGDKYHGPDRWAEDIRRQKALERVGWVFWRVWGSHWSSDRQGCLHDLVDTLDRLGIKPLGAEPVAHRWTEHRLIETRPEKADRKDRGAGQQQRAADEPILQGASARSAAPTDGIKLARREPDKGASVQVPRGLPEDHVARVGDYLVIRYTDTNKVMRVRISDRENRPDQGVIHTGQPLGRALLQTSVDDEVEFSVGGKTRTVVVEKIEREMLEPAA
ncbi:MAG TPA: AAA domain-containing protein, partial [Actinomycetota bacterium]|nr:AAA domain-containing protein [Actinomycetota bacterium]